MENVKESAERGHAEYLEMIDNANARIDALQALLASSDTWGETKYAERVGMGVYSFLQGISDDLRAGVIGLERLLSKNPN